MQLGKNLFLRLPKMKKISRFLLIFFVLLSLPNFTSFGSDNLFKYQWALKNNGNFMVNKNILEVSYKPVFFDALVSDTMFFADKNIMNFYYSASDTSKILASHEGIDTKWEEGFNLFKSVPYGRDIVIAVIDTGIDITHPDLKDSIWVNVDEIANNGIDDDANGYIDDVYGYNFNKGNANVMPESLLEVHGTHAAGIISGSHVNGGVYGLAYDEHIKIMPLKVLDANENGYMASVIDAITYAKNNGATICNISLGTYSYDASIDKAIRDNSDMLFIVSAGNGMNFVGYSLDERDVYPAKLNLDNVISVSNIAFDGKRYVSANYGSYVDVFAPGTYILSTTPYGTYAYLTGTSMSAPFVSALCAMIYSRFPNVPISSYKNIIINTSTPIESLLGLSKSNGIINVYEALKIASTF